VRRRVVLAVVAFLMLVACNHSEAPAVLTLVYNHFGFVMEPAPVGSAPPRWSHKQALAAITKGDPDGDKTRTWFGYYQGHPAWLAITNNALLAIPAPPGAPVPARGHRIAVFADGETPVREITEVDGAGIAPVPNIAPRRAPYDGRLHLTYITAGAAEVAATTSKWMVEPAPKDVRPTLSVEDAIKRSRAASVNQVDAKATRVYFGLFTGLDSLGGLHAKTPGWLVVGTLPEFGYAVTAFSDDLTQPWVSRRVTSEGSASVAY
jgi:hypothetical protein